MDGLNSIPSPARTPGSVDPIPMDVSAPSTPLAAPLLSSSSVPSLPGTPLVFTPAIGGSGGHAPSIAPPTPNIHFGASPVPVAARFEVVGGGSSEGEVKMDLPPPPVATFQYQAAPSSVVGKSAAINVSTTPRYSFSNSSSSEPDAISGALDSAGFALSDLLMQLEDYTPTIPDSLANHYLHQAGFESADPRMSRLLSLAAQKYISDVLNEAFTHCKLKGQANHPLKAKIKDKKYTLTMEDLLPVLSEHGLTIKKPPYYT